MVHKESEKEYDRTKDEMIDEAYKHRIKHACTVKNDKDVHEYLPVWATTPKGMNELNVGPGIRLYFDFIMAVGIAFTVCFITTLPNIILMRSGNMATSTNTWNLLLAQYSVANLGICDTGECQTYDERWGRRAMRDNIYDMKLYEWTEYMGFMDTLSMLLVVFSTWYFSKRYIPHIVRQEDRESVTAGDFAVMVDKLPKKLENDHENYEGLLRKHFINLLKKYPKELPKEPIPEVALVRDYDGGILKFQEKGRLQKEKKINEVKLAALDPNEKKADKQKKLIEKKIKTAADRITAIDNSLHDQAKLKDVDREVSMAFVIFHDVLMKDIILAKYQFSNSYLLRCCLPRKQNFEKHGIRVQQAPEPGNLKWENLDFNPRRRTANRCFVFVVVLVLMIICTVFVAYLQALQTTVSSSEDGSYDAWVLRNTDTSGVSCLHICGWHSFTDYECYTESSSSSTWKVDEFFTPTGVVSNTTWSLSADGCSDTGCTSGVSSDAHGQNDWIGVKFAESHSVSCVQLSQPTGASASTLQLYACTSSSVPTANYSEWYPEDNCVPFEDLTIPTVVSTSSSYTTSGSITTNLDTSCAIDISLEVAQKRPGTSADDPISACFCEQQFEAEGVSFLVAPYGDEGTAKKFCEDWSESQAMTAGLLVSLMLSIVVVNMVLVMVFHSLVEFERHITETGYAESQMKKLLLSQFVSTGILVLYVNANFRDGLNFFPFNLLKIGQGAYDDTGESWFIAVGTGIITTMILQTFTTTFMPIFWSFIYAPLSLKMNAKKANTQDGLNQIFLLPQFDLPLRVAQSLNLVFVILMYSGGMPILYFLGMLYAFIGFWLDKFVLLRGSSKPKHTTGQVIETAIALIPVGVMLHCLFTLWTFGNQSVFPSYRADYASLAASIIGYSESTYETLMYNYRTSTDSYKDDHFEEYIQNRITDMGRKACWILFLFFFLMVLYYGSILLWEYVLKTLLKPFKFTANLLKKCCCGHKINKALLDESDFPSQKEDILKSTRYNSYLLKNNEHYKKAHDALSTRTVIT